MLNQYIYTPETNIVLQIEYTSVRERAGRRRETEKERGRKRELLQLKVLCDPLGVGGGGFTVILSSFLSSISEVSTKKLYYNL